ncbi:hypothetical protein LWI29_005813 [Acer saccharum]|uniref:Uncharacterized protein n=1 Tax=Acer saccharum TaxID=4024 RepID=A0AA39S7M6_ACESA|nr:hypothetical protein LWI29_005813 [Acer saccharum]
MCYYRFDQSFQPTNNNNNQDVNSNQQGHMATKIASPETVADSMWYPDNGANDHCTPDLSNLNTKADYSGNERIFVSNGAAVVVEICEELFTRIPVHVDLALNGVEVFMNASGSHHQLRKLATHTRGEVYMYSNQQGCDGGRRPPPLFGHQHMLNWFNIDFTLFTSATYGGQGQAAPASTSVVQAEAGPA